MYIQNKERMMSSQWFEKALNMGRRDRNTEANNLDLTLKLGLPGVEDHHPPPVTGTVHQGTTHNYGTLMGRGGLDIDEKAAYSNLHSENGAAAASCSLLEMRGNYPHNPGYLYSHGYATGFPINCTMHNSFSQQIGSADHTSNSNVTMGGNPVVGNASLENYSVRCSSSGKPPRRRGTVPYDHQAGHDPPNKRCMNRNCNANSTPMWRRGPLGPKTLCNACGIKYRKEEDRKKFREAAITSMNNTIHRN